MDYTIWNNWFNKSKLNYEKEKYEMDKGKGKIYPIVEAPNFLDNVKKPITLRNLRYKCFQMKLPCFEVDEELSNIISKTKNKIYLRELPFDCFFVNVNLKEGFQGLLIHHIIKEGKQHILIHYRKEGENGFGMFGEIYLGLKNVKDYKFVKYQDRGLIDYCHGGESNKSFKERLNEKEKNLFNNIMIERKEIEMWVCNFLDVINHPDVEIVKFNNKYENDDKRIQRGKSIKPSCIIVIKIKGKLYRYLNKDYKNINKPLSYSFWVRGHYIHFWNKKRWCKVYSLNDEQLAKQGYQKDSKGTISKWKFPFIKCKGRSKPILKNYILKQKKETITNLD